MTTTPEPAVSPAPTGSVVLCGSLDPRRVASLMAAADWYRANVTSGTVVHVPLRDPSVPPEVHADRWYRLIDMADRVVVVTDPSGYIGEQTAREQAYAVDQGCDVVVEAWQPAMRVSPAPDTDELRVRLGEAVIESLYDDCTCPAAGTCRCTPRTESVVAAVLPLLAEREAGLRADLDRARAERDAYKADAAQMRVNWHGAKKANLDALKTIGQLQASAARSAGARTIPDDAAVETLARWLFRMNGRTAGESLYGDGAASPERQEKRWNTWLTDTDRDRLREVARTVLADLGATPTTGPAPDVADGEVRALLVHPAAWNGLVEWLKGRGLTVDPVGALEEIPTYSMGISDELARTTGLQPAVPQAPESGPLCPHCRCAPPFHKTCCPDDVPQAPAQPTATVEDVCNGSGVVPDWDAPAEQWHVRGEMDTTGEPPGRPCEGCENCTGRPAAKRIFDQLISGASVVNGVPQTPAAREDTAPPQDASPGPHHPVGSPEAHFQPVRRATGDEADDSTGDTAPPTPVVHDITMRTRNGYTSATCSPCGIIAGDYDPEWVQDRVDSHRADNLIPPRPSAPAVDGDRPDCTNDLSIVGPHPSEPGCEVNGDSYCRECADDTGPGDQPEESPSGVSQEGGKP